MFGQEKLLEVLTTYGTVTGGFLRSFWAGEQKFNDIDLVVPNYSEFGHLLVKLLPNYIIKTLNKPRQKPEYKIKTNKPLLSLHDGAELFPPKMNLFKNKVVETSNQYPLRVEKLELTNLDTLQVIKVDLLFTTLENYASYLDFNCNGFTYSKNSGLNHLDGIDRFQKTITDCKAKIATVFRNNEPTQKRVDKMQKLGWSVIGKKANSEF